MGVNKVVFGAVSIMDISDSTVTPDKLAKGATAYDKSGEKITGTMEAASDPVLQAKSVAPKTTAQTVTPDSGYDGLSEVTVNAMPTATQATPSISVNSSGLITATATQSAGYVSAGTKSATKQLTTQAAKTITPSTSQQTAVAKGVYTTGAVTVAAIPSTYVKPTATKAATTYTPTTANQTIAAGTYCSGTQTIKGDANLVAGNIKSGVSIFGVAGSYEGSGGGSGGGGEVFNVTINDIAASAGFRYLADNQNFATASAAGTYQVLNGVCVVYSAYPMVQAEEYACLSFSGYNLFKFNSDAMVYDMP